MEGCAQALLPGVESPVLIHPGPQLAPAPDESLVDDLYGFPIVRSATGYHQAGMGQFLGQGPGHLQLVPGDQTSGVFSALAGADQLDEDTPRLLLFKWGQVAIDPIGVVGQGTRHPADGLIAIMGQLAIALMLPQFGQGKFQQGQIAGLIAYVVQNTLHQPLGEANVLSSSRFLDGPGQLFASHGSQLQICLLQGIGEGTIG